MVTNIPDTNTKQIHFVIMAILEREMFYLTTHSTHFIYGYMASDIWLRTILIVRKETRCRHIGYSFRLAARVLLYALSHRQDNTYHGLCYTSRGALAGTRNSSMGPPHEGSIRRPTAPWANALPLSYVPLLWQFYVICLFTIKMRLYTFILLLYLERVTTEMQGKFRTIIIFSNRKQYMYQNVFYCQFSSKSIHYVTSKLFREFIKQNLQYD